MCPSSRFRTCRVTGGGLSKTSSCDLRKNVSLSTQAKLARQSPGATANNSYITKAEILNTVKNHPEALLISSEGVG